MNKKDKKIIEGLDQGVLGHCLMAEVIEFKKMPEWKWYAFYLSDIAFVASGNIDFARRALSKKAIKEMY